MNRLVKVILATLLLVILTSPAHAIIVAGQTFVECKGAKGGLVCLDANGDLWKCPWGQPCTKT